jgi:hypothetical protein
MTLRSFDLDFENCEEESKANKYSMCYYKITRYLLDGLYTNLSAKWVVSAGETLKFETNLYILNDLYFEFHISDIQIAIAKISC